MEVLVKKSFEGDVLFFVDFEKELPAAFGEFKADSKNFEGKFGEVYSAPVRGKPYSRIVFISLGEKKDFEPDLLRRAAGTAVRIGKSLKREKLGLLVPRLDNAAKLLTEGALLADYKCVEFKSKPEDKFIKSFTLVTDKDVADEVRVGKVLAECQNYMRRLDEQPANLMPPSRVAQEALALAKSYKSLRVTVFDEKKLKQLGMHALLAVGSGSMHPPRLVTIEYNGAAKPFYAVVGKGITFDSGGISLKPSAKMHEMKYDKSGAMAALAAMRAAAELRLPIKLVAVLALAENMPSGSAQRPGDIWKSYSGKTIEVLNTDAEGRLVLVDALAYIAEKKPDAIIDMATLTGAIVVALGRHAIGLFSNDDLLASTLEKAGKRAHERVWRMPVWKEYSEMMKSDFADIKNISDTGEAGSITAAAFLKEFIGETKWAHLDIAGVDLINAGHPYLEKGASGMGVRLLTETFIILSEKGRQ